MQFLPTGQQVIHELSNLWLEFMQEDLELRIKPEIREATTGS